MTIADEVANLLKAAVARGDQDIFCQGSARGWLVYGRRGARRQYLQTWDLAHGRALINFFKYHGQMNLSEQRRPQIGAWHYQGFATPLDLRLTSVGDFRQQETLVIRLLTAIPTDYQFLNPQRFTDLQQVLRQRGLILFAGPTGSGKTTLMYYLAQQLAATETILTIEEPPEIVAPEFIQMQVNQAAGMTYQALLEISLRLRPDVLIIGEIRDPTSAAIAAQAALSGHLVLATVHARSSGGVIQRLQDLQLSIATLASCVTATCYQRLLPLQADPTSLAVNLDLLTGAALQAALAAPQQSQHNWRTDLQTARDDGTISNKTFQTYQFG